MTPKIAEVQEELREFKKEARSEHERLRSQISVMDKNQAMFTTAIKESIKSLKQSSEKQAIAFEKVTDKLETISTHLSLHIKEELEVSVANAKESRNMMKSTAYKIVGGVITAFILSLGASIFALIKLL